MAAGNIWQLPISLTASLYRGTSRASCGFTARHRYRPIKFAIRFFTSSVYGYVIHYFPCSSYLLLHLLLHCFLEMTMRTNEVPCLNVAKTTTETCIVMEIVL